MAMGRPVKLTPHAAIESVRTRLLHKPLQAPSISYLDTGDENLNEVLGHRVRGIPYGKLIEISGRESGGKTAIAMHLAGLAQKDGASVIWLDLEGSFDATWAATRGIDCSAIYLIQPYVGVFGTEKRLTITSAEQLCSEVEKLMYDLHLENPDGKIFMCVDSLAAMRTEIEAAAGNEKANLKTKMGLPEFLGRLLRGWVAMAQTYSATILMINQLRDNPMQMFGDPSYTPGGNAPKFYAHIRARAARAKGGRTVSKGRQTGIQGILTNYKNKAGGLERTRVGYKLFFSGKTVFLSADKLVKDE